MNGDRFWNLFAKNLAGEASEKEVVELNAIIQSHPELSFAAQHIADVWAMEGKGDPEAEEAYQKHLSLLKNSEAERQPPTVRSPEGPLPEGSKRRRRKLAALMSAFLLVALIGFFLLNRNEKPPLTSPQQTAEVSTPQGSRSTKLVLPDSSVVWLNAGSRLTYDRAFGTTQRNTTLSGEAFFEVKKSAVPFVIHTGGVRVKVLGTSFNVKSYPGEGKVETSLVRGRVEVTIDNRPGEKFVLNPNEKLTVANDANPKRSEEKRRPIFELNELTHVGKDLILETSWVDNKLVFHNESFEEVARKMERWYNVEIAITDAALAGQRVGGGPFEKETIEQALTALQFAFDFKFSQKGNSIVITR